MWYCSECGKKNNGKFCTRCGTKHTEIEESTTDATNNQAYSKNITWSSHEDAEVPHSAAALFRRNNIETQKPLHPQYKGDTSGSSAVPEDRTTSEEITTEPIPSVLSKSPRETTSFQSLSKATTESPRKKQDENILPPKNVMFTSIGENENTTLWSAPFLHELNAIAEKDNGSAEYFRQNADSEEPATEPEATAEERIGITGIFTHRKPPENNADREWKLSKRLLLTVGSVGGVICLAVLFLIISLLVNFSKEENALPASTGIYYYVSGAEDTLPLYAEKSIKSDILAFLENGDAVEFLDEINAKFTFVYDKTSEQYGYVNTTNLVKHEADVDYGEIDNQYANEKSLGYFYVTKVEEYLSLWENSDGGGVVKAKLENGFKISLLEKTNDSYWYVFDYNSAERGYVRTAYLTDSKSKVVYPYKEPADKTVIGEYYVTGVQKYLPIYAKPRTNSDLRGKLYNGDKVGLIEKTTGSFWYVSGGGVYGWISAKYLTETPPAPATDTPVSNDYKVTNTNEYLPVLSEPKVGGNEIGKIHNGDAVTLIKEYDAQFWYVKVPSLGIEGYVAKDYLTK